MSQENRNRSEGWKHAKLSGHENEETVCDLINKDKFLQQKILQCAHKERRVFIKARFGGLCEKNVPSILEGTTKSKTDIYIDLDNGETINISLKKEKYGQVYLIGTERFLAGYEKQYGETINDDVKRAIRLYWGYADDVLDIASIFSDPKYLLYEKKKHRLVANTLNNYDENLSFELIHWFNVNLKNIFDYCFSKGLAKREKDWANLIWYKNKISGEEDMDTLINIKDFESILSGDASYGKVGGGTTIQLSFGFAQWHSPSKKIPGDMQFHHSYDKLVQMIQNYEISHDIKDCLDKDFYLR